MATAPTRTDAELVRRLQARDRDAWEELYAEYQQRLRAFGYRLAGNAHDADDLAHETFVRVLPALDRLDPETTDLGAYLFATAKNLFLKQVERAKRAEPTAEVPEPDLPAAIEDDPERSALLARQQEEVRIANGRLDPRQRLVLALCELEDRSYAEIGELVGLNENAVAQLVFRARERLRTELRLVQVDPDSLPAECRAFLPLLAQHLDGRLRSPKLEQTLAHLEECERCQTALADMREAKRRYRALFLPPLSTEDARAAVEDELERVGYWRGPAPRPLLWRPRGIAAVVAVAVAAALCLAGGLGAAALLVDRPANEAAGTTVPSPTTSAEVTETAPATTPPPSTEATAPSPPTTAAARNAPSTTVTTTTETESQPAAPSPPTPAAEPKPEPKPEPAPAPPVSTPRPKVVSPPSPKDTTSPTVTITAAPAASTAATSASFSFSADEPQVSFACRLDAGAWAPCASPRTLGALALGQHAFEVRGTDRAGNVGAPASRRWTVTPPPDTTLPTVTLTQVPPATTISRTASFAFAASEPGATFACSYDSGPFVACTSPHTIADAGVDDHTFAVRATDAAGNTGSPAVAQWTVVAPLPDLVAVLTDTTVTVRNVGQGPAGQSLVTVLGVGTFPIPALAPGQSTTHKYACVRGTITATADYARVVAESNEDNNTTTRRVSCLGLVG